MSGESLIKNIKIFGERNSGTRFLTSLIKENIKDINIYSDYYKGGTGWKHGFPRINLFKNLNTTLFIFIIRDLNSWIKSMYFNPYHYKRPKNIRQFLTKKLEVFDKRKDHDVNIYKYEHLNIINLRTSKIISYLNFYRKVDNAIFVNLEDLQNNDKKFLVFLKNKYNLNINEYTPIKKHTKNKKLQKNRNYNLIIPRIIHKNTEIEKFTEILKKKYYYKTAFTPTEIKKSL